MKHPMADPAFTRNLAPITPLPPQARASSSGRFQRVKTTRWRARIGAPVRMGRPSAVTPELANAGMKMLRAGMTIDEMIKRLGVARRSWYRYVHRTAGEVRPYKARKRRANSISAQVERQMLELDKKGLARVVIAERLGLHINTVVKYLLRAGRPRRR